MAAAGSITSVGNEPGFWVDIPNVRFPESRVCTGGRPRPQHLRQAQKSGVRAVIDLCAPSETSDYDEGRFVESLGMHYLNIPIAGPADLSCANARKLADALLRTEGGAALIHCASGNRVGALLALKDYFVDHGSVEHSLAVGRAAGLQSLEPEVRCILAGI
jgi:protein tyrosine phosphatase (PTP) superfamily phosphohydrolase (DUF442 family)